MAHPNEDLVREAFAAFGRGDMDYLQKQIFSDDVRYHQPGRSAVAGDYEGPGQVIGLFARIFELTGGTFSVELHDVLANDEHAVALYTARGEREGKQQLSDNNVLTAHIRDGKASELWVQPTDMYTEPFSSWLWRLGHGLSAGRRVAAGQGEAPGS
jgi:ketosteroid isomerase-like protein